MINRSIWVPRPYCGQCVNWHISLLSAIGEWELLHQKAMCRGATCGIALRLVYCADWSLLAVPTSSVGQCVSLCNAMMTCHLRMAAYRIKWLCAAMQLVGIALWLVCCGGCCLQAVPALSIRGAVTLVQSSSLGHFCLCEEYHTHCLC